MRVRFLLSVLVSALAIGCSQSSTDTSSTTTSTTAPTGNPTTENFTGTVAVGGSDVHSFTVVLSGGQLNVILTAAGPPPTIQMGLGIGSYSGTTCTLFSNGSLTTPAGSIAQLTGTANAGTYCVQVSDVGNQTAPVNYAVTVTHF
ncbi:MAG: hypothetical protein LAO77_17645 [Acidobacteriia bacterium]|nr:hypothetical protein [Terriglobia bacterium]